MTGIFDNMAGALNNVFGAPVPYWTAAGEPRTVQGVFRHIPTTVFSEQTGKPRVITQASLKVPNDLAGELERDVQVQDPTTDDDLYRIISRNRATASPAANRFMVFELEAVARDYK